MTSAPTESASGSGLKHLDLRAEFSPTGPAGQPEDPVIRLAGETSFNRENEVRVKVKAATVAGLIEALSQLPPHIRFSTIKQVGYFKNTETMFFDKKG